MLVLSGLGVAVVLLYFWLIGHWFARVLVFIALAVGFGIIGGAMFSSATGTVLFSDQPGPWLAGCSTIPSFFTSHFNAVE